MSEEEIFDKPADKPKEKPPRKKRELSEAQKAALAKGRAKMAEKRAAAKSGKTVEQLRKEKEDEKAKKEKEKEEKKLAKESKKGEQLNEKQKKEKILDEYNDKKCAILSRCTNVDVFNRLNKELEDITEEDILSEGQAALKDKLLKKLDRIEKEENIKIAIMNTDNSDKSTIF